jgi:hypothetical protein
VWGGKLTAISLPDRGVVQVECPKAPTLSPALPRT